MTRRSLHLKPPLLSHAGPLSARVFAALPTNEDVSVPVVPASEFCRFCCCGGFSVCLSCGHRAHADLMSSKGSSHRAHSYSSERSQAFAKRKDGTTTLLGAFSCKARAQPRQTTQAPGTGHIVGRCTFRARATPKFANACYCRTCRPALRHFCGPRPGHRRALGSLRSQPFPTEPATTLPPQIPVAAAAASAREYLRPEPWVRRSCRCSRRPRACLL